MAKGSSYTKSKIYKEKKMETVFLFIGFVLVALFGVLYLTGRFEQKKSAQAVTIPAVKETGLIEEVMQIMAKTSPKRHSGEMDRILRPLKHRPYGQMRAA